MTAERITEARQRACYHPILARMYHDGMIAWSEHWQCLDCKAIFDFPRMLDKTEEKEVAGAA